MQNKKVSIYTTPFCAYCKMAKQFFEKHEVEFSEYNVQTDAERRKEMVDKSGQLGVPVIAIADSKGKEDIIIGFDQDELSRLLEL